MTRPCDTCFWYMPNRFESANETGGLCAFGFVLDFKMPTGPHDHWRTWGFYRKKCGERLTIDIVELATTSN